MPIHIHFSVLLFSHECIDLCLFWYDNRLVGEQQRQRTPKHKHSTAILRLFNRHSKIILQTFLSMLKLQDPPSIQLLKLILILILSLTQSRIHHLLIHTHTLTFGIGAIIPQTYRILSRSRHKNVGCWGRRRSCAGEVVGWFRLEEVDAVFGL